MERIMIALAATLGATAIPGTGSAAAPEAKVHVWEKVEITLTA